MNNNIETMMMKSNLTHVTREMSHYRAHNICSVRRTLEIIYANQIDDPDIKPNKMFIIWMSYLTRVFAYLLRLRPKLMIIGFIMLAAI